MEAIYAFVMIGCFCGGLALNKEFENKYAESAIDLLSSFLISLFLIFALYVQLAGSGSSGWTALWISLVLILYVFALMITWKTTKEVGADQSHTIIAMAAQALFPLGTALMILFILAAIFGVSGGKRKK